MFSNRRPIAVFHRLLRLQGSDEDPAKGMVRVPNQLVDATGEAPWKFRRMYPVIITNLENGLSVLRYVYGAGWTRGMTGDTLALSYDGFRELGLRLGQDKVELEMRGVGRLLVLKYQWNDPDPRTRANNRTMMIGFALGVAGLLMAIAGFVVGMLAVVR